MANVRYTSSSAPAHKRVYKRVLIGASQVVYLNGFVTTLGAAVPGYAEDAEAGDEILGNCVGFEGPKGELIDEMTLSTGAYTKDSYFTAGADNTTVDKVYAVVDVTPDQEYSLEYTGTPGTGFSLEGYKCDLSDKDTLDATATSTGKAQMYLMGVDPQDSTRRICRIFEHQYSRVV